MAVTKFSAQFSGNRNLRRFFYSHLAKYEEQLKRGFNFHPTAWEGGSRHWYHLLYEVIVCGQFRASLMADHSLLDDLVFIFLRPSISRPLVTTSSCITWLCLQFVSVSNLLTCSSPHPTSSRPDYVTTSHFLTSSNPRFFTHHLSWEVVGKETVGSLLWTSQSSSWGWQHRVPHVFSSLHLHVLPRIDRRRRFCDMHL